MRCFCYLRSSCSVLRCTQNKTAWLDSAHGEHAVVAGQILCLMFWSFSISSTDSHADAIEKPEVQWTIHMHHREVFVANSYHLVQQRNNPLRHWRLKFTTDAKCNGATEGSKLHTKPSVFWKLTCPMSWASTSQKMVRITYSQLPVSCHDCSGKERGQRWGHMPALQMLPRATQTTHEPATLQKCLLFFCKQQTSSVLFNLSNCVNYSVYELWVVNRQFVCQPVVGCHYVCDQHWL